MLITPVYTANVDNNAPAGFKACVQRVADLLSRTYLANVTMNITVDYLNLGGPAATSISDISFPTYAEYRSAVIAAARSQNAIIAAASLPAIDPSGGSTLVIARSLAVALGLAALPGVATSSFTSTGTWTTDNSGGVPPGTRDLEGSVFHEFTEVLGRVRLASGVQYRSLDLFSYTSAGTRNITTRGGYFSIDNGATNLSTPNAFAGSGDAGDWSGAANDACNATITTGVVQTISTYDLTTLDAMGWVQTLNPNQVAVGASGRMRGKF